LSGQALTFENQSGVWHYQPLNYSLTWQEQKLELSNTERKILLTLLQAPYQVFSREQLLSAVSDYPDHRLARTIDSHIKSIRKQLAMVDANVDVIHTHRGLGYALCPA
ncbi:winged helix-turn-helix domain-containing protein, partial [Marinobacter sp. 1Y8]